MELAGLLLLLLPLLLLLLLLNDGRASASISQPLTQIGIHNAVFALQDSASIKPAPALLGTNGEDTQWVYVDFGGHSGDDAWIAVFSPSNFNSSSCPAGDERRVQPPYICSAPIKYKWANESTGNGSLKFQLINQRQDFSFALFTGGLSNPKLVAVSQPISFANTKAPLYPRLALGKSWNEMTVTWTSGYNIDEAVPFVQWGLKGEAHTQSPAGTLTFTRNSMCGPPARTVGWRDPGFFHTTFMKDLWPNSVYTYQLGHKLHNGSIIWSKIRSFKSSPYPGQDSLQRVIIFGDMGKAERDGSNEYSNYQPGSLNTTETLINDLDNYDIVFHIGDLSYANGYISQWDQFTQMVEPIASTVPYMVASGNHERDYPGSGSFYDTNDSGGECGVVAETMFYVPADNRAKFWYETDYGMFHFCIADTEHDWRQGSEQYKHIEKCLASADRQKQPWLIFIAHRVLGYSSSTFYASQGSFDEPMGRDDMQKLWQKYKVDIAFFGHVHNYERSCPIYQNICVNNEKTHYSGTVNGTIHVVVGGGGSHLSDFSPLQTYWSVYRDRDLEGELPAARVRQNGEVLEDPQGGDRPPRPVCWEEGGDRKELRRRSSRPRLRPLFGCRDQEVPGKGYQEGFGQEDCQEVQSQVLREARELQALNADQVHSRCGLEGRRIHRIPGEQGEEGSRLQGRQGQVRGEVQDRKEQVVLYQTQVLGFQYLFFRKGDLYFDVMFQLWCGT